MADDKLIFPIGFDLEEGVAKVEKDWGKMQNRLQDTFKSQTIQVDADISKAVLDKLYAKFEGLIKTMESKAPQIKLKMPDTVDFEQEINRLKVQLKSINLGELTDAESKDLYLYIRQLEALAKALKEVNKQEQLRQANNPANKALQEAIAQEKLTRAKANDALAEQRRAKIATETARQNEINNRSAQRGAVIAEQKRAATARAEQAELRLTQAKQRSADATERQNAAYGTQSTDLARLAQRMIAYASISQLVHFVRNIRAVTAEFELQRISLGALIGDMDRANVMFEQIKADAVKSPFQVKELVTYTKQLAAYKVGSEELFDTTQRLADISAGLGVSMDRLILAYGQVKATGYLRASEVRQFTEAGIPIVEELAKKMSAFRGETVSAAEVMGMISDRAISFEQVKDIFDDMTSAGGMFYKMQEKQAETLHGQVENLKDSFAIMYDEIGRSKLVNTLMKLLIDSTKSLAQNWEYTVAIIGQAIGAYAGFKVGASIMSALTMSTTRLAIATRNFTRAKLNAKEAIKSGNATMIRSTRLQLLAAREQVRAATATTLHARAWHTLKAAIMANPIGAIITGLIALISIVSIASSKVAQLSRELGKIGEEGNLQTEQEIRRFDRLATKVKETADGTKTQAEALKELKRAYADFLPEQAEEIKQLLATRDGYEAVNNAIREKIALQTKEKQEAEVTSHYSKEIEDLKEYTRIRLEMQGKTSEEIAEYFSNINKEVQEAVANGEATFQSGVSRFAIDMAKRYASIMQWIGGGWMAFQPAKFFGLDEVFLKATLTDYHVKLQNINEEYEETINHTGDFKEHIKRLRKEMGEVASEADPSSYQYKLDIAQGKIEKFQENINRIIATAIDKNLMTEDFFNDELGGDMNEGLNWLAKHAEGYQGMFRQLRDEYAQLFPDDITKVLNNNVESIAETVGLSMDTAKNYLKSNNEDMESWRTRMKTTLENATKEVLALKTALDLALKSGESNTEKLATDLARAEKIEEVLKKINEVWNFKTNKTRGGKRKDPWIEMMENRMKYMQDFQKGVEKLAKTMTLPEAIAQEQKTMLSRGVYLGIDSNSLSGSVSELEKWYEDAIAEVVKKIRDGNKNLAEATEATAESVLGFKSTHKATKDLQKLLDALYKALTDFKTDSLAKEMEKKMKKLSDDLSRTKTAKEFFDNMLGLTGDKQLSATLTLSVYGTTGDDLKSALVKQVQGAFAGQDLSKAINTDLNSIDLSALREIYNNLPKDFQEQQKKSMKQVLDMLEKGQNDLANNFAKLLMDYDEMEQKRVTITQKATQEIATLEQGLDAQIEGIRKNKKITDKDSAIAQAKARAEAVRKAILAREKLELSKLSPEYIRFFSSINTMAMETANSTRTQLRRALFDAFEQGAISAEELRKELKAVDTQFNKLNENATLFSSYATGGFDAWLQKLQQSADELDAIATRMMKLKSLDQMDEGDKNFVNKMLNIFGDKGQKSLSDLATSFNGDMSQMGDAVQKVGGQMQGMFSGAMGALSIVDMIIKAVHQSIEAIQQVLDQINSMRSEDNQVGGWFKYISDFDKYAMSGWENLKSGNIAGALADTASSIISIFQNIQADKIKKIDDEIERQQESLDQLAYSYKRLQKAQEKAFGSDYISNYEQRLANLQAQVDAYQKQYDAELSKGKKADEEKLKEYQDAIRDTNDAIKDMQSELSEYFLGTDLTSAARDFANAWIDAYKEFGSTTDAMKEKFQDMIQNMIVESFAAKIIQSALSDIFTEIDNMTKDGVLDMSEASKIADMTEVAVGNIDVGMTNLMNALSQAGISVRGMGSDLTGISRDIATASEESILGLAAGINTQNFYISQIPPKLDVIIGLLQGGNLAQGSAITLQDLVTIQNQHLSYLPSIAQHTAETVAECKRTADACVVMVDKLNSVIKPRGTQATHTVNTSL